MADLSLDSHVAYAFPTPVVTYPWRDSEILNRDLATLILDLERRDAGLTRSNVGGWHGGIDFMTRIEPCVDTLRGRVVEMTMAMMRLVTLPTAQNRGFDFGLEGWPNVLRDGAYHALHNHPHCLWSGVYYVSVGLPEPDSPLNGRLELIDPRPAAGAEALPGTVMDVRQVIAPASGLMVVFPAWLGHVVHPFRGRGERISVAFNVTAKERKPT